MKFHLSLLVIATALFGFTCAAADSAKPAQSLEEQLKALNAGNTLPAAAAREKLYAVQERYLPLRNKSEFTMGAASNLTGDDFVRTEQYEVGYHFHFNDRWSLGLSQAWVNNNFKSSIDNVKTSDGAIPDVPFAYSRTDLMLEANLFYGKFRWTAETVSYFDLYMALGPAMIRQNTGTVGGAAGDLGLAAWISRWGSARLGLKDYYYRETYRSGAIMTHNLHAHLDIGYLF